jgi:deoxyribodipyrimidine photo-lyase
MSLQVVWFKRDLRIRDHAPLTKACLCGKPVVGLYVFEDLVFQHEDMDAQHAEWISGSLRELRASLAELNIPLLTRKGDLLDSLNELHRAHGIGKLYSHQETGLDHTFQRDRAVKTWCLDQGIPWSEDKQQAVVRGPLNRDIWHTHWSEFMNAPLIPKPDPIPAFQLKIPSGDIPTAEELGLYHDTPAGVQRANGLQPGEREAFRLLHEFHLSRGNAYHREMSSPLTAVSSCSRLSPYLAWGNISIRTVVQRTRMAIEAHREARKRKEPGAYSGAALRAFESRLHWHCHFIQKLETEPEIEFHCFHRPSDTLRESTPETLLRLDAWKRAQTGYPFVDACMRALQTWGWINFRMRAMLVSFAAYDLWIDWRLFHPWLARQFIDFEPGIHIPQIQMQSGVTGINTLRMYNPIKQGEDHDPDATFMRHWLPELKEWSAEELHSPWKVTGARRGDYPMPIVDHKEAVAEARRQFGELRRSPESRTAADAVQQKHGSRVARRSQRKTKPVSNQPELPNFQLE